MLVDINLLPEKIRERTVFLWIAVALLLLAIISWALLYWMAKSYDDEAATLQQSSFEVQKQQEHITSQLRLSAFGQEKEQLSATVDFLKGHQYKTHPLIEDLVTALPDRGFFQELTFTAPNEMTLKVQFDDLMEPALYLTRVKASPLVIDATFEGIETEKLEVEERENVLPRYFAVYFIQFKDDRALSGSDATVDPNAIDEPQEQPAADEPRPSADVNTEGGGANE
ncbi:hypothetical protein SporoP37_02160 [Sporosarcina sp. P37]|uniref:hypothetical protein n=1 Tax=unclassified Sporosarcina TaxID=2647733 RepID=UPI000A17EA51|nr:MULTISPECIES: hypothetical protein [unclassified Sporosarcina]ARK23611.1 hypothetical protein SporoP37_02160 [Sporosarcina sp. P37]PID18766.1 fimbrial assembly protein [Sporosarcina sp. P35]